MARNGVNWFNIKAPPYAQWFVIINFPYIGIPPRNINNTPTYNIVQSTSSLSPLELDIWLKKDSYIKTAKLIIVVCTAWYSPLKFTLHMFYTLQFILCSLVLFCVCVCEYLVFHLSCRRWVVNTLHTHSNCKKKLQIVICLRALRSSLVEICQSVPDWQINPNMASTPRFQPGQHWWGWVLSPLRNLSSPSILMSMDATLYFHLLRSICTVTPWVMIFMHCFHI